MIASGDYGFHFAPTGSWQVPNPMRSAELEGVPSCRDKGDSIDNHFVGDGFLIAFGVFRKGGNLQRLSGGRLEADLPLGKATAR